MTDAPVARRRRWLLPLAIVVADGLAVAVVLQSDLLETWTRFPVAVLCVLGGIVLLALWVLFLSGLRLRTRWALAAVTVGIPVLAVVAIRQTTRWEGSINGAGVPRLVWKWEPLPDESLPQEVAIPTKDPVNLTAVAPTDFPRFLGAQGRNEVVNVRLARDWSAHPPQEVWRQRVGAGWGSFAVVGRFAITQEQRGDEELVICYEVPTGRARWSHAHRVRFTEKMGGDGPRATPTVVDGRVYALGATGILDCLDGASGTVVWSRDVLKERKLPNLIWGKSSSPLVLDDIVVVSGGDAPGPSLLAFRRDTGEPAWEAGADRASYASAVLARVAGARQILSVNAGSVTGHAPTDGRILWQYPWPGEWAKASQPVPLSGDRVFISAGYGVGCALLQLTAGSDGKCRVTEVWKNKNLKTQFTNVAVRDEFAYGLDDGILVCLDLASGRRKWKAGRYGHGQLVRVGDLLVVQAESGAVVLVEATPDGHHELGRFQALDGKTWNNPVVSGEFLLVRNDREAACYHLAVERTPEQTQAVLPERQRDAGVRSRPTPTSAGKSGSSPGGERTGR